MTEFPTVHDYATFCDAARMGRYCALNERLTKERDAFLKLLLPLDLQDASLLMDNWRAYERAFWTQLDPPWTNAISFNPPFGRLHRGV